MSKGMNPEFVRERYARMSDNELIRVATQDAVGLTEEAFGILKTEVKKRGLDSKLTQGVAAQNREYTIEELTPYCNLISSLQCPTCNKSSEKLSAAVVAQTISMIIITNYEKRLSIGCPSCVKKKNIRAIIVSLLFGWWGIPWGPIRTIQSGWVNLKNYRGHDELTYNENLYGFVLGNIGEIEVYKDDRAKLQELIMRYN